MHGINSVRQSAARLACQAGCVDGNLQNLLPTQLLFFACLGKLQQSPDTVKSRKQKIF